ncbi:MAG: VOC family protein [Proteobacteria bacterium]|nr:MAG: VOC family protein [Pseudomonadota bacterium]
MQKTTPFLMFKGRAKEAIKRYQTCFAECRINHIDYFGNKHKAMAGCVKYAEITINGQDLILIDSPVEHAFGFTPSISFMVDFEQLDKLKKAYHQLSKDGEVMMPLNHYDFAEQYAWFNDSYGVSWQFRYGPK